MNSMQFEQIQNEQVQTEQIQAQQTEQTKQAEQTQACQPEQPRQIPVGNEAAGLSGGNAEYRYQFQPMPGSRFRHCNAKLTVRDGGNGLYLIAELPIFVNRSEYAGVGAALAKLNGRMGSEWYEKPEDPDFNAFKFQEGFILDVIEGTIRYEINAWSHVHGSDAAGNAVKLRRFAEHIAGQSIYEWSESILRMVSNESINLEREEHRKRLRAAQQRKKTPFERIMDFLGLSPSVTDVYSPDEDSDDISDPE